MTTMLFKVLAFLKRWWKLKDQITDRRMMSAEYRARWERSRQEREALERRLNYLETQVDVYARKDL